MAGRIRDCDWAVTSLGPIADWPPVLKTAASIMLSAAAPMACTGVPTSSSSTTMRGAR